MYIILCLKNLLLVKMVLYIFKFMFSLNPINIIINMIIQFFINFLINKYTKKKEEEKTKLSKKLCNNDK